jgi:hypothetical protein
VLAPPTHSIMRPPARPQTHARLDGAGCSSWSFLRIRSSATTCARCAAVTVNTHPRLASCRCRAGVMLYILEVGGLRRVAALAPCRHGRLLRRAPGAVVVRIACQLCAADWCALHEDGPPQIVREHCQSGHCASFARWSVSSASSRFWRTRCPSGSDSLGRSQPGFDQAGRRRICSMHSLVPTRGPPVHPVQEAAPPVPASGRPPAASGQV